MKNTEKKRREDLSRRGESEEEKRRENLKRRKGRRGT